MSHKCVMIALFRHTHSCTAVLVSHVQTVLKSVHHVVPSKQKIICTDLAFTVFAENVNIQLLISPHGVLGIYTQKLNVWKYLLFILTAMSGRI